MNLLQISNSDQIGGAARVAWDLHQSFNASGSIHSKLLVGQKLNDDANTEQIDSYSTKNVLQNSLDQFADFLYKNQIKLGKFQLSGPIRRLTHPRDYLLDYLGIDNYHHPDSRKSIASQNPHPDIIHMHNLHINYFDLNMLPGLSNHIPTVCTLHDCWMFTGHCAHYLDCNGWQKGCPTCPHLNSYPPIRRDNANFNLRRKKKIYQKSKLSIVTPSKWLMNAAEKSILSPAIQEKAVIYNGVDQSIFHPMDQKQIRRDLGIAENALVLLFVANNAKDNIYKDYQTIDNSIRLLAEHHPNQKIVFICIGSTAEDYAIANISIHYIPFMKDTKQIAKYYSAADLYLHAAKADNCPLVILEALSCGVPVIATGVGGIPELINENETGYLIPSGDSQQMTERIIHLLDHPEKLRQMKNAAFEEARVRFSLQNMATQYVRFYEQIMEKFSQKLK